jgi:VIT1/CCC1 family predicted Fe2+/Mn2+ transporter
MQSRARAEAPEQKPQQETGQTASAAQDSLLDQTIDQLAKIAALSSSVKQAYIGQLTLTKKIAKAEWRLTGRSLILAAALVVCFGTGIILFWGSILLLLGYVLLQLSSSLLITAVALVVLQFILLLWCWRSLGYLLSQTGFANTWHQLRQLFFVHSEQHKEQDK